jgi:hypothetical protein
MLDTVVHRSVNLLYTVRRSDAATLHADHKVHENPVIHIRDFG